MRLAGVTIAHEDVLELADRLTLAGHRDTARVLLSAAASGDERLGLTIQGRETILSVLDDPPDGLLQLRAVLLADHVQRLRNGLANS